MHFTSLILVSLFGVCLILVQNLAGGNRKFKHDVEVRTFFFYKCKRFDSYIFLDINILIMFQRKNEKQDIMARWE